MGCRESHDYELCSRLSNHPVSLWLSPLGESQTQRETMAQEQRVQQAHMPPCPLR